jgi:pimeloyl-ACP methyl ester carboxylesterase
MPEIVQGNCRIYYECHGEGYPLVLIRGLGSNADHWYAQVPDLSRHFRVITFDNRGIARSTDPGGPFTIADMAEDTIHLMNGMRIEQAHVLGLSLGGMVAQEMAIRHPQRINRLVLVVTLCGGKQQIVAEDSVREKLQRMVLENSADARIKAIDVFFALRTIQEHPQVLQQYAEVSMKYPASMEILQRQYDAVARHDTYDRLDRIKAPTLVLTGEEDVLIPPGNSEILAEHIPGAELRVISGGGHQIMIEQSQACNQAIVAFLQKVDST